MKDFKRPRFGGGNRDGGRGGFGGPRREERELFQATCSNCNKACEVPFRPNGTKPVFCKDCFVRPDSDGPRNFDRRDDRPRRDDRRERNERPSFAPTARVAPDTRIDDVLRTVSVLSQKLDTVIDLIRRQQLHVAIQEAVKPDQKPKAKAKPKTKKK